MRSTHPLRPARRLPRRTLAPAGVTLGAILGIVTLTGLTAASASAEVGASNAGPLAATALMSTPSTDAGFGTESVHDITADARATLEAARAALTAAEKAGADVAASGLDVAGARTTVDTAELREQIERLSAWDVLPLFFLPGVAEKTDDETKSAKAETATLRAALDAARAQRAAEEAAAKAQRDAAAEAAAAAAAAATANTSEGAKAVARQISSAEYGWGADQFSCLDSLWNRESGWNYQASNPSSGAFGIPQALPGSKMASAGGDWQTNAATQIRWGLQYIAAVYGTPCGAWSHSQGSGWY